MSGFQFFQKIDKFDGINLQYNICGTNCMSSCFKFQVQSKLGQLLKLLKIITLCRSIMRQLYLIRFQGTYISEIF